MDIHLQCPCSGYSQFLCRCCIYRTLNTGKAMAYCLMEPGHQINQYWSILGQFPFWGVVVVCTYLRLRGHVWTQTSTINHIRLFAGGQLTPNHNATRLCVCCVWVVVVVRGAGVVWGTSVEAMSRVCNVQCIPVSIHMVHTFCFPLWFFIVWWCWLLKVSFSVSWPNQTNTRLLRVPTQYCCRNIFAKF